MTNLEKLSAWNARVGGAVHNVGPDDIRRIAWLCLNAELSEGIANVWHQSSIYHNTTCNCLDPRCDRKKS